MRKIALSFMVMILLLCSSCTLALAAAPFKNQPTGAEGIEWGTRFDTVADRFIFLKSSGGSDYYRHKDIDRTKSDIKFIFENGLFVGTIEQFPGTLEDFVLQMDYLYRSYGPGVIVFNDRDEFESIDWFGDITTIFLSPSTRGEPVTIMTVQTKKQ